MTFCVAQRIVEAVRTDDELPYVLRLALSKLREISPDYAAHLDSDIFRLAQDLVDTRAALERAYAVIAAGDPHLAQRLVEIDGIVGARG